MHLQIYSSSWLLSLNAEPQMSLKSKVWESQYFKPLRTFTQIFKLFKDITEIIASATRFISKWSKWSAFNWVYIDTVVINFWKFHPLINSWSSNKLQISSAQYLSINRFNWMRMWIFEETCVYWGRGATVSWFVKIAAFTE